MAVTILERPEGVVLNAAVSAIITNVGAFANVTKTAHGLATNDYIYITSNIENYNGFWQIVYDDADNFYIVPYSGGDQQAYIVSTSLEYQSASFVHGWSCAHLPITYRLSTNLYPTNSSDTTRNVNSVQDAHGYTVILLSGSLGAAVNSYDFVKLTLPNDTELSGVYQIIEFVSPTVMIINLTYNSGNNFTGATALKHYNNYNFIVRVYAGINASHQWAAQKPYELAATLLLTPDENNEAFFSINEILKSYIETRNNLTLGTLPNNIDFWTNFYIETAESYDDSDGYVFGTLNGPYTSDQSTFEGTAANAKLEFKNIQSGSMSEYVMVDSSSKFLTLFDDPVLFEGIYQDISFIKFTNADYVLTKQFYLNGNPGLLETETISGDSGVYRIQLEANCDYDRVDVSLLINVEIEAQAGELILTGYLTEIYIGPPT